MIDFKQNKSISTMKSNNNLTIIMDLIVKGSLNPMQFRDKTFSASGLPYCQGMPFH